LWILHELHWRRLVNLVFGLFSDDGDRKASDRDTLQSEDDFNVMMGFSSHAWYFDSNSILFTQRAPLLHHSVRQPRHHTTSPRDYQGLRCNASLSLSSPFMYSAWAVVRRTLPCTTDDISISTPSNYVALSRSVSCPLTRYMLGARSVPRILFSLPLFFCFY
jgi:hypothetical protein